MRIVVFENKSKALPECLEELSPEQYVEYLKLVLLMNSGQISVREMKVQWLSFLLDLRLPYTEYKKEIFEAIKSQEDVIEGFFTTEINGELSVVTAKLHTGINLLPQYQGLTGPGDMLNGITFGEFTAVLEIMRQVSQVQEDQGGRLYDGLFGEIAKLLYKRKDGKHAGSPDLIFSIHSFLFFSAVWNMIRAEPIEIQGRKIDFRILFGDEETKGRHSRADDQTGWVGIAFEVAKDNVFGNLQQVNDSPFWEVLLYLYKCKYEFQHQKQNLQ